MTTLATLDRGFPGRRENDKRMRAVAMLECRVCGASYRISRVGCFNCGSLLRVAWAEVKECTLWVSEKLVSVTVEPHVLEPLRAK